MPWVVAESNIKGGIKDEDPKHGYMSWRNC